MNLLPFLLKLLKEMWTTIQGLCYTTVTGLATDTVAGNVAGQRANRWLLSAVVKTTC